MSVEPHHSSSAMASGRSVYPKARRIRFRFGDDFGDDVALQKYFLAEDIVFSHFIAALSAAFPPGEEAFIRSVRRFADQIIDPVLKKRVAGFIGQESMHGQEHRRVNETLVQMGYPIGWWEAEAAEARRLRFEERLNPKLHLAMTAAFEHYTAVLAERTLAVPAAQDIPAHPEIRNLLNWHALEELEHKSVAFDVYRAVGGSEWMRIAVMVTLLVSTVPIIGVILGISLLRDPVARRQPIRLVRELRQLRRFPVFSGMFRDLARYARPGFHPDDIDTTALEERWREQFFGDRGVLTGHLK